MKRNVASQNIGAQMVSATDGSAFTGTVTAYITGDGGTQNIGSVASGVCTHKGNGYQVYAPSQAETNFNLIAFTFIGSGAVPATVQVETNTGVASNIKQNQAFAKFEFLMTDSTNHNPATGKTVGCTRSIDAGAFSSGTLSGITEISNGIYSVDFAAADMNGVNITLRCTATGCDDVFVSIVTEP